LGVTAIGFSSGGGAAGLSTVFAETLAGAGFSGGGGALATGAGFPAGGASGFSAGLAGASGTALFGTGLSNAGMTAAPPDAGRFTVEWTTITAVEIKAAAAIKTPASRTARTASAVLAALGLFRRLTPPCGFFPAARGVFFAVSGFTGRTGFAGDFSVFFMQITLKSYFTTIYRQNEGPYP
jgi:hypothetical protein